MNRQKIKIDEWEVSVIDGDFSGYNGWVICIIFKGESSFCYKCLERNVFKSNKLFKCRENKLKLKNAIKNLEYSFLNFGLYDYEYIGCNYKTPYKNKIIV
jgi:hypothetical protein